MNFCRLSLQRLLLRYISLFLVVGFTSAAQQHSGDKPKVETLKAGVDGVSMPKCQYCPSPEDSQGAKKKKYEGVVVLIVVITSEGKATDIRVAKSPGMGLDEKAIEAVREWRFKPAMKDGKPVAVQVPIEVRFRLFS